MRHRGLLFLFLLAPVAGVAQFPFLRSLEVRPGQQRPAINCVAQDSLGLLWVGADIGLFRTDGERVDVVLRTEGVRVNALAVAGGRMLAALQNGVVLRCTADRCDTVLYEPALKEYPVRSMVALADGRLVLATYGAGVWVVQHGAVSRLGAAQGLPDDHVNDLAMLPDQRFVVATDQGLALCTEARVLEVFDEQVGAPDNLVLSVGAGAHGEVWAGTDRRGVFRWIPGQPGALLLDSAWTHGPVISLAVQGDLIWAGTQQLGVVLHDIRYRHASYRQQAPGGPSMRALDLFVDREGAAWWCDATDRIHRADPAILFVAEHEGLDLRTISALCTDAQDRIWFATADGVFSHAAAFSEELHVTRVPLGLDPRTPIVSLAAAADGTVWAASFGSGVFAIGTDGGVVNYTTADGLGNDNVLAVRAQGDAVWFATLEGVTRYHKGRFQALAREAGFVFDVLPLDDGALLMATDGRGVLRWDGALSAVAVDGPHTYYTLARDAAGVPWAAGPGTGLCRITAEKAHCLGAGITPFDGDLFAVGNALGRLVAFGSTGVAALDPATGTWTDLSARFGLQEMQAQLNVITTDADSAIWMGCDKGLLRIRPTRHHFDPHVPVIFTALLINGEVVSPADELRTTHDRNDITIRFTGLHYTDPGALRFEYGLDGPSGKVVRTRDREAVFSGLVPGVHRFRIRAFVGEPGPTDVWSTMTIVVARPWWRLPWVISVMVLVVVAVVVLLVRARERRIRYRDRMEQEKVRFQLEALRSQVDPHFLFNSFNTLVDLIETDAAQAVEHVEQLSTFFRNILLVRDKDLITVEEELRLLGTYFALEKHRFGAAIDLRLEVPAEHRQARIVPLTLQLLVENALKHNVATADQPLVITITVADGDLVVVNSFRPRLTPARSTEFGLDSIRKRYTAFTDRPISVVNADGLFRVRIPLIPTAT